MYSCADLNRSEQLERLNEGRTLLDSINVQFADIDTLQLTLLIDGARTVHEKVEALNLDTIDYAFANKLDRFRRMGLVAAESNASRGDLEESISATQQAVDDLLLDIENGHGKRQNYDSYIDFELTKIEALRGRLKIYSSRINEAFDTFDELHVLLLAEIDERIALKQVY